MNPAIFQPALAWGRSIILTTFLLSASSCAILPDTVANEDAIAAQTSLRVKTALINTSDIDAAPIRVRSQEDGSLLVDGYVDSQKTLDRVTRVVDGAAGNTSYRINLKIR